MKNFFVTLLISIFCLSACTGDRCIDADDFGFMKFVISSRYKKEELTTKQEGNQIAPWVNSGYTLNGKPLTIVVKRWDYIAGDPRSDRNNAAELSAWGPWYGQESDFHKLSVFCLRLRECRFEGGQMCTPTKNAQIGNAPCILKNGVGLYFLMSQSDPNSYEGNPSETEGITRHLGEPVVGYELFDFTKRRELLHAGGINYQYDKDEGLSRKYVNTPLYFKIVDRFYEDNNGQYRLVIKSGVHDTGLDPLEYLTKLIREELFGDQKNNPGIVKTIYQKIINNPSYKLTVTTLLTLYVMFTGASFVIGNVNFTHTELIVRLLKIVIVSMLFNSTSSWEFFHDYLFVYFVEGVEDIKRMIDEAANTGPGSPSIIGLMIAPQTMAKLFSLLFVDPLGFIYIILFLIALYFIFMLVFKATIIYLTALITIGMIIIMGPIFICFILFGITRSLFENWLRQLISYAIQPIILFAGIAFISMIVRTEIYSTLGFAVCKYDFPDLAPITTLFKDSSEGLDSSIEGSFFYWWFPSPMKSTKFQHTQAKILVPIDHTGKDEAGDEKLCQAYECIEERYIEFPFLDLVKDKDRIDEFFQAHFVQIPPLLLIFVCIYLLRKFNEVAVDSARFLTSTSGNLTQLQSIGSSAYMPIHKQINRPANYVSDTVKRELNTRIVERASMYAAGLFEGVMMQRLNAEALNPKALKSSILAEVKKNYGIDYSKVNFKAPEQYYDKLEGVLRKFNSTIDAGKFVGKNYSELQDHLAKQKFGGKAYDSLNSGQKQELDQLMRIDGNKSLRELASEARLTQDAQKAYVETYLAMSKRGLGILGKRSAFFRTVKEIDRLKKEKEELAKAERKSRGKQLYAAYNVVKRAVVGQIVGKEILDMFEGNVTGADLYDFNYQDPMLRTNHEIDQEQKREREDRKLQIEIDKEKDAVGTDISSPEYLAMLEQQGKYDKINRYENLTQRKLIRTVYQSLIETHDKNGQEKEPALMGERFMREKATDQQTRNMIDNISKIEESFIKDDMYIHRQEDYEIRRDEAQKHINEIERNPNHSTDEVEALHTSRINLDLSLKVLNKIKEREEFIKAQFRSHIQEVNEIRVGAQMAEYNGPTIK